MLTMKNYISAARAPISCGITEINNLIHTPIYYPSSKMTDEDKKMFVVKAVAWQLMAGGAINSQLLWSHKTELPFGHWLKAYLVENGLADVHETTSKNTQYNDGHTITTWLATITDQAAFKKHFQLIHRDIELDNARDLVKAHENAMKSYEVNVIKAKADLEKLEKKYAVKEA
jgi:hypothetical protein